jgi:hypothetical protein
MARMNHNPGDDAERELRQVLLEMPRRDGPREICPTPDLLRRFVAGAVGEEATRNRILAHLDVCPRCVDAVVELRNRRIRIRRSAMALVAVVLIAALLWIWPIKPSPHSVSIAIVDLSVAGPTRSNHHLDVSPVKAGADTRQVRIVLPKVSADGMYEIAVFVGGAEEAAIRLMPLPMRTPWNSVSLWISPGYDLEAISWPSGTATPIGSTCRWSGNEDKANTSDLLLAPPNFE